MGAMMKSVQDVLTRYQANPNSVSKQEIESVVGRPVVLPKTPPVTPAKNYQINSTPMTPTPPKPSQISPKPVQIQQTSPYPQAQPQTPPKPAPNPAAQGKTAWDIKS